MKNVIKIKDIVYGEIVIYEPVVLEIIDLDVFQRLKGINQIGYIDGYNPPNMDVERLRNHHRFEHSIGVYWLLKKNNDSLESQISGLLHDVSHTAFSHTADYIFRDGSGRRHNYQDDNHEDFIKKTKIPEILEKYGVSFKKIIEESNFPLLENEIPEICADRLDYSLRTALYFKIRTGEDVGYLLQNLKTRDEKWYFENEDAGYKYAKLFKELNDVYYADFPTAVMFYSMSRLVKYAVDKRYLSYDDFKYKTDNHVLDKINNYLEQDKYLKELFDIVNNPDRVEIGNKEDGAELVYCKSRIVDPLILVGNKLMKLSEIESSWGDIVKKELIPRKYYVKVKNCFI